MNTVWQTGELRAGRRAAGGRAVAGGQAGGWAWCWWTGGGPAGEWKLQNYNDSDGECMTCWERLLSCLSPSPSMLWQRHPETLYIIAGWAVLGQNFHQTERFRDITSFGRKHIEPNVAPLSPRGRQTPSHVTWLQTLPYKAEYWHYSPRCGLFIAI